MASVMVLGLVVAKILQSRVPKYSKDFISYLVTHVKISHFKGTRTLHLHRAICYPGGRRIIAVDWGRRLWVAELGQGKLHDVALFDVVEEGTEFGLGR